MPKFLPQGTLTVQTAPDSTGATQLFTPPAGLTIKFTITRKAMASTQTAQFRVYGLGKEDRRKLYKDQFDLTVFRTVTFAAGYQNFTPLIFNGTILKAYSEKEGNTDTVTVIDAFDGGFPMTNGFVSTTVPPQTRADAVIVQFGAQMPGIIGKPTVGFFPTVNMRTEVLAGNTWGIILDKSGGNAAISNGQLFCLNPNEGLPTASAPLVSADTGLLGVPRRSGAMVELDMVFEPRLNLFQSIDLESTFNPQWNGLHKIVAFEHRGAINAPTSIPNTTTGSFLWFPNTVSVTSPTLSNILISQPQ